MNKLLSFYKNTFFRVFFKNNVKYCSNKVTISFKSHFWIISDSIGCEFKDANTWNRFVMIINILNHENTVTLSLFIKSSYDGWWKQDCSGHDVSSIGLGCWPFYKWPPFPPCLFINEVYLELSQTSIKEGFWKSTLPIKPVNYFCKKKAPSKNFNSNTICLSTFYFLRIICCQGLNFILYHSII